MLSREMLTRTELPQQECAAWDATKKWDGCVRSQQHRFSAARAAQQVPIGGVEANSVKEVSIGKKAEPSPLTPIPSTISVHRLSGVALVNMPTRFPKQPAMN
jgi:hypothetical protein